MQAFGDVSGDLRGLIRGHCDVVVVGVVFGDSIQAGRCPKRTVRRVDDIPEAKWNDLTDVQKRRLFECSRESDDLSFGCAVFQRDKLHTLKDHYLLHQDVEFPPAWDLALTGYAYGEILFDKGAADARRVIFEFDRVASKPQSEAIVDHVQTFVPETKAFIEGSRQSPGIQAADCLAGGIAEDEKSSTEWCETTGEDRIHRCSESALIQLENDLDEHSPH